MSLCSWWKHFTFLYFLKLSLQLWASMCTSAAFQELVCNHMVIYSHRDKDLITLSCERQTQRWDGVMKINCQRVEVKWRGGDDDDGWQRPRGWWEMTERGREEKVQQEVMSCCTSRRKYRKSKKWLWARKWSEEEKSRRRRTGGGDELTGDKHHTTARLSGQRQHIWRTRWKHWNLTAR